MDEQRFSALSGIRRLPLLRVFRAVLGPRVQGAQGRQLGNPATGGEEHVSQLGFPSQAPDLRRLPLRSRRWGVMSLAPVTIAIHTFGEDAREQLVTDVRAGLTSVPKTLPSRWFYDELGSRLFEA